MKVCVLCSGGMDSVTALQWAAREHELVGAVSFDYGSKHNHRELPFAAEHARRLGVRHWIVPLGFMNELFDSDLLKSGGEIPEGHYAADNMRRTVVPFRNGIMLAVAAGLAESRGAEGLVIAAHGGDHAIYPDCREPFMRAMAEAMRAGTYAGIALLRPFIDMDKGQIAALGGRLGVDFARTWSCYKGGEVHCGRCGTCVERREAFQQAGLPDPTVYAATDPLPPKPANAAAGAEASAAPEAVRSAATKAVLSAESSNAASTQASSTANGSASAPARPSGAERIPNTPC